MTGAANLSCCAVYVSGRLETGDRRRENLGRVALGVRKHTKLVDAKMATTVNELAGLSYRKVSHVRN